MRKREKHPEKISESIELIKKFEEKGESVRKLLGFYPKHPLHKKLEKDLKVYLSNSKHLSVLENSILEVRKVLGYEK